MGPRVERQTSGQIFGRPQGSKLCLDVRVWLQSASVSYIDLVPSLHEIIMLPEEAGDHHSTIITGSNFRVEHLNKGIYALKSDG